MKIEIWQPRWKDRIVLIAKFKVQEDNDIVFTKTKSIPKENIYRLKGSVIRQYPLNTNGTVECYAVPMNVVFDALVEEPKAPEPAPVAKVSYHHLKAKEMLNKARIIQALTTGGWVSEKDISDQDMLEAVLELAESGDIEKRFNGTYPEYRAWKDDVFGKETKCANTTKLKSDSIQTQAWQ